MRITVDRILPLLLALAALLVWVPCLDLYFCSDTYLLPVMLDGRGGVDWQQVGNDLTGPWMGIRELANWRPLVTLHYALDLALFGLNPLALHLSNLALHLGAGLFVLALLRRLFPGAGPFAALLGAFIYLVHPARVEAVAWIPGRVDVTAALPAVAAVWFFLCALDRRGDRYRLGLSLLCALLAYGAKEMALALPAGLVAVAFIRRRPGWLTPLAWHLGLLGLVLLYRFWLFGSLTGGAMGDEGLPAAYLTTLPAKFQMAFVAPLAGGGGRVEALAPWVVGLVLPLAAGVLRGRAALAALPLLGWWLLLLVPASPIAVCSNYSGSRVLLLPALPAAALITVLLGRPGHDGRQGPLGTIRWVAAGLLIPLAVIGTWQLLDRWRHAGRRARAAIEQVAALPEEAGKGPLGVVALPQELPERPGVDPFRYDVAFLAFRPPFAPHSREVLILQNCMLPALYDGGPLDQAASFCRRMLWWDEKTGRFTPFHLGGRQPAALVPPGRSLDPAGRLAEPLELTGPGWSILDLGLRQDLLAIAAVQVSIQGAGEDLELRLCTLGPDTAPAAGDPRAGLPLFSRDGQRRDWLVACGNSLEFKARGISGASHRLVLAARGGGRIVALRLLGSMPRHSWQPTGPVLVDPAAPVFPVPPGFRGPCRLVIISPGEVMEHFYRGDGSGRVALPDARGRDIPDVLLFLRRLVPDVPYYFYVDRLGVAPDPRGDRAAARAATIARTRVFTARHVAAPRPGVPKGLEGKDRKGL